MYDFSIYLATHIPHPSVSEHLRKSQQPFPGTIELQPSLNLEQDASALNRAIGNLGPPPFFLLTFEYDKASSTTDARTAKHVIRCGI